MKKFLYFIAIIIILIYLTSKGYQNYKSNYLSNNEAVVNIYFKIDENEIDNYFKLPKGTYDKNKHFIYCSLKAENRISSNDYYNLPLFRFSNNKINCGEEFSVENHIRLRKEDISNYKTLYVRLSTDSNSITNESSTKEVASKIENIDFKFGKINNFILLSEGIVNACK